MLGLEGLRFTTTPFARHFAAPLAPVLACFDAWITSCEEADAALAKDPALASNPNRNPNQDASLASNPNPNPNPTQDPALASAPWDGEARAFYIRFLRQYRHVT